MSLLVRISDRGCVRQVQGHCEYVDRNAKLDDGRAKCGEIHQQFRLKDMMDDKHIGDLRALETIQGLPEHPNTGLCLAFRRLVLEAEASDLLSGSECRVLLFNDMVRHLSAGRDSATSLFGICAQSSCGQVIVADKKQELLSRRHYLRFRDKLDLDPTPQIVRRKAANTQRVSADRPCVRAQASPAACGSPQTSCELSGEAVYETEGRRVVRWSLQFSEAAARDGFLKALRETADASGAPPPAA